MAKSFTPMRILATSISSLLLAAVVLANGQHESSDETKDGPSLSGATGWLNTQPLNLEQLKGKVVLVDFWTYTCINWRRTLPYVNKWASKYKDQGLVVIGIHTPEFSFEHQQDNIKQAIKEMNILYPVAVDSDYRIWQSFQNNYWPALYLIDANGKLGYQKFGEGDYLESELMIQKLLKERLPGSVPIQTVTIEPTGYEEAADWQNLQSPENYLGHGNTQGFASPGGIKTDKQVRYVVPEELQLNQWALSGEWTVATEKVILNTKPGKIVYRFHARDVNLVMGSGIKGPISYRVLIDGKAPAEAHGLDLDENGNGKVNEPRMYQLIRQKGAVTDREFQIEFLDPKVEVYDFTFG